MVRGRCSILHNLRYSEVHSVSSGTQHSMRQMSSLGEIGLKLVPGKDVVEVMVVDKVEKASEN